MNTYDVAIRLTDGSRKTMTVRATIANAAEKLVKERDCAEETEVTFLRH